MYRDTRPRGPAVLPVCAVLALAAGGCDPSGPSPASVDVTGAWEFTKTFSDVGGGVSSSSYTTATLELTQDGERLTGRQVNTRSTGATNTQFGSITWSESIPDGPVSGSVSGDRITLDVRVGRQGDVRTFEGRATADQLEGDDWSARRVDGSPPDDEEESPGCSGVGTIAVGQSVNGTLSDGSCTSSGRHFDPWVLELDAAADLRIDLTSTDFDAYLFVTDTEGNLLAQDDDGGGSSNARIQESLPAGTYVVWATSYHEGATGTYQLAVAPAEDPCAPVGAVAPGETVSGTLSGADCTLSDWHLDLWLLELTEETSVRIDLTSTEFDAYLVLTDQEGNSLAEDDDGGSDTNARIDITLPAGTYGIWATSYATGETGAYQLSVSETNGAQ